jgi:hypothetical protein
VSRNGRDDLIRGEKGDDPPIELSSISLASFYHAITAGRKRWGRKKQKESGETDEDESQEEN